MNEGVLRLLCGEPENYSVRGLETAASLGRLRAETLSQEDFEREAVTSNILLVRLRLRIPADLVEAASDLRAVVTPTTGLNHVAMDALRDRGIPVFHLRGETEFLETITSTAEFTFGLLLALMRKLPAAVASVKEGKWVQRPFRGRELKGKRLGVLGYGRLGRMVAQYGHAFGMEVLAFDPALRDPAPYVVPCLSMDDLLGRCDVLSVHVPLNDKTLGLLGRRELDAMRPGAVVVNTSRGEVVDETALLDAVACGRVAGYATDVLANEHGMDPAGHPLIAWAMEHDNVIITPHIGGAAEEAIEQTDLFVLDRLKRLLQGTTAVAGFE